MSALRLRPADTAELLKPAASPLPRVTPWPYRIAAPFIMLVSLTLWAVLWQAAAYMIATVLN